MRVYLLILLLILIIGLVFARSNRRRKVATKVKYVNSKKVQWLLSGYVFVLVSSFIISYFIPSEAQSIATEEEIELAREDFHQLAYQGDLSEIKSEYLKQQWEFPYDGTELTIAVPGDEYLTVSILVEKKNSNDGVIEAFYYTSPTIIDNIIASDKMNPIQLELAGNDLSIMKPEPVKLVFITGKKEFTISQFMKEDQLVSRGGSIFGQRLLYLKVPAGVELKDSPYLYINYVNGE